MLFFEIFDGAFVFIPEFVRGTFRVLLKAGSGVRISLRSAKKNTARVQKGRDETQREVEKDTARVQKSRVGLKGRQRRQFESKRSRVGLEGRQRTLLIGLHDGRTWPSGMRG